MAVGLYISTFCEISNFFKLTIFLRKSRSSTMSKFLPLKSRLSIYSKDFPMCSNNYLGCLFFKFPNDCGGLGLVTPQRCPRLHKSLEHLKNKNLSNSWKIFEIHWTNWKTKQFNTFHQNINVCLYISNSASDFQIISNNYLGFSNIPMIFVVWGWSHPKGDPYYKQSLVFCKQNSK